MKSIVTVTLWTAGLLNSWMLWLAGATDWSLIGWAFAGSTAFVVWEVTQNPPINRKGWQRFAMIALGMLVSLSCNAWLSEWLKIPIVPATSILGAVGYKLLGWMQKKADKPDEVIDDLTKLPK
ncbi:hypothetical protein A6C57_00280 [Fibrella sp. ES10-3-2-2]|nr:hypothetical protein A6C57_00280 [Fibrella sp. ES10-3-2-2]